MSIESFLDRIPGLSENFVYANDDMFFNSPVTPEDFVTPDGKTKVRLMSLRIEEELSMNPTMHDQIWLNTKNVLEEKLGRFYKGTQTRGGRNFVANYLARMPRRGVWNQLTHSMQPLNKTMMREAREMFPRQFETLAKQPFRDRGQVSPLGLIYYYSLWRKRAIRVEDGDCCMLWKGMPIEQFKERATRLLEAGNGVLKLICVNEGDDPCNYDWYSYTSRLFPALFPHPSHFEKGRG